MFMTTEEKTDIAAAVVKFGKYYGLLRHLAEIDGAKTWHIKPKVHIMQHIPRQCRLINARYTQNYLEEGLIGKITKIWKKSVAGPHGGTVQECVLVKYLVGIAIRFEM